MGLFKFLKEKFSKKNKQEESSTQTYVEGMSKSRLNFASKLDELSKHYKEVNQDYFEELEIILIEADVGVNLALRIIEETLEERADYVLTADETGEYGRIVTLNANTDMPVDKYLYKIPAGKYKVTTDHKKLICNDNLSRGIFTRIITNLFNCI